ncbi:hypothetical protein [Bradyrhizobium elkanii]|uniref:hypothetical protein n=1 Tax=Bradyrhizobium elkanii TaxID=29448 RepID=UPI001FD8ECEF|nr:hypothetical protein [Bradyrhizobium elkanii]
MLPALVLLLALGQVPPAPANKLTYENSVCRTEGSARVCRMTPIPVANMSNWKFTRAQGIKADESFVAIMKTADALQSDPDFAGLIIRCAPKGKIEVLVALIRPFPPRSRPEVTLASTGFSQSFEGTMAAAGAAVLLPEEAGVLAGGKWQITPSLTVTVKENTSEIKGIVALNGLREAYSTLLASCSQ